MRVRVGDQIGCSLMELIDTFAQVTRSYAHARGGEAIHMAAELRMIRRAIREALDGIEVPS